MTQLNDIILSAMRAELITATVISDPTWGTINDVTQLWLMYKLSKPTGTPEPISDLWEQFFDQEVVASGAFNDRYSAWLTSEGFTGALNDQMLAYWSSLLLVYR